MAPNEQAATSLVSLAPMRVQLPSKPQPWYDKGIIGGERSAITPRLILKGVVAPATVGALIGYYKKGSTGAIVGGLIGALIAPVGYAGIAAFSFHQ